MGQAIDNVQLHWIWRETINRVEVLSRRVAEGKDILAASEFARWLEFSGIVKLLEQNPNPAPLKVDGAFLRWKCSDLLERCTAVSKAKDGVVRLDLSQLEDVNRKLDIIASHVAKLSPPLMDNTTKVGDAAEPALLVIQGGR
jgi:hypothetical protein